MLQQILFFRELGFELKKIKAIICKKDFDKRVALIAQKAIINRELLRLKELLKTIDKTIKYFNGEIKMKEQEMFFGIDAEKQKEYEKQLKERFGAAKIEAELAESKRRIKGWTKKEKEQAARDLSEICKELVSALTTNTAPEDKLVQELVRRHHAWLSQFWTPTKESYPEHGKFIVDSDLKTYYDKFHKDLARYLCKAIEIFSKRDL